MGRGGWFGAALALGAILFVLQASAQPPGRIYLDLYSPAARKLPIALPEFKRLGVADRQPTLALKLAQVISDDLENSGLFRVFDRASYLEDPQRAGLTLREQNFPEWANIVGTEALVKGGYLVEGQELRVEARLFDVVRGTLELGKRYIYPVGEYRLLAHKFANAVIQRFTGVEGVFDTQIVFVSRRRGNKEIFRMDYDGYNIVQLTRNGSINLSPSVSPDGARLAYTSYKGGQPQVYLMEEKGEWRVPWERGAALAGLWSPDGKRLALTLAHGDNFEVYLLEVASRRLRRLTRHWAIDISPAWSPDGKQLVFVSSRSGSPQLYILGADGSGPRRITFEGVYNTTPAWSPRGDKIAFSSRRKRRGNLEVFLINPDGSGLQQLTSGPGDSQGPAWSPDGRHLAFTSTRDGDEAVYVMTAGGTRLRRLTEGSEPYWTRGHR
ncbi:MAG: Tol-Pal system beta propeller repeat protein TolB [Nitrospinota bacterium]